MTWLSFWFHFYLYTYIFSFSTSFPFHFILYCSIIRVLFFFIFFGHVFYSVILLRISVQWIKRTGKHWNGKWTMFQVNLAKRNMSTWNIINFPSFCGCFLILKVIPSAPYLLFVFHLRRCCGFFFLLLIVLSILLGYVVIFFSFCANQSKNNKNEFSWQKMPKQISCML